MGSGVVNLGGVEIADLYAQGSGNDRQALNGWALGSTLVLAHARLLQPDQVGQLMLC